MQELLSPCRICLDLSGIRSSGSLVGHPGTAVAWKAPLHERLRPPGARHMKRLFVVLACLATVIGEPTRAEPTKLRFILDWKAQGPGAWYYFARDKGYFAAEGLDVTIDQGDGSAAAVSK